MRLKSILCGCYSCKYREVDRCTLHQQDLVNIGGLSCPEYKRGKALNSDVVACIKFVLALLAFVIGLAAVWTVFGSIVKHLTK